MLPPAAPPLLTPVPPPMWQSKAVLVLVVPAAAVYVPLLVVDVASLPVLYAGLGLSVGLAVVVYLARAATLPAALLGGLLALCYALTPAFPHSPLWMLGAMLVLTLGSSRVGRAQKQAQLPHLALAEAKHGRAAAQVAANLGVGALSGTLINSQGMLFAQMALVAALAQATADTLASELGQLAPSPPRMLLTGRVAAAGTDGAVSLPGTAAAAAGAALLGLLAHWVLAMPWWACGICTLAAVFGLFFDSLLGQLLERRGYLNNDAVNFLSTLAAAVAAVALGHRYWHS